MRLDHFGSVEAEVFPVWPYHDLHADGNALVEAGRDRNSRQPQHRDREHRALRGNDPSGSGFVLDVEADRERRLERRAPQGPTIAHVPHVTALIEALRHSKPTHR
jgi:hypothetical protein